MNGDHATPSVTLLLPNESLKLTGRLRRAAALPPLGW